MSRRVRPRLSLLDLPLALLLLAAFFRAPSLALSRTAHGPAPALAVTAGGRETVEPLTPPRRLSLSGPLGETLVEIGPEGGRVLASPCPGKTCVRSGLLSEPGQAAACVPNRVALRRIGGEGGVDAVSF